MSYDFLQKYLCQNVLKNMLQTSNNIPPAWLYFAHKKNQSIGVGSWHTFILQPKSNPSDEPKI